MKYLNVAYHYPLSFNREGKAIACVFNTSENEVEAARITKKARHATPVDSCGNIAKLYFTHVYDDNGTRRR